MLSYIHAFHAGNHGDILKHLTLSLTIQHLLKKDKPFSVIDTHSASGRYNLNDERLEKTKEAESGIQKLLKHYKSTESLKDLNYLKIAEEYSNKNLYTGSPELSRCLMRSKDELILNELHPQVINELKANMKLFLEIKKDELPHIIIKNQNALEMIRGSVPPATKRGCVIIDPSYEDVSDFSDTGAMFLNAYKKWNTGTYLIWYPLLAHRAGEINQLKETVSFAVEKNNQNNTDEKTLFFELTVKEPEEMTGLANLYGSGMIVVNPSYGLEATLNAAIPEIKRILTEKK